jgi:hypothetical protein
LQRLAIDAGLHCEEVTGGLDEHIGAIDLNRVVVATEIMTMQTSRQWL